MKFTTQLVVTLLLVASVSTSIDAYVVPQLPAQRPGLFRRQAESALQMSFEQDAPIPTSFREAEVLGLRLMQEGNFQDALVAFQKGMKLPGSRPDVVRTKSLSGPSPVGGAFGGTDSVKVLALDDFEKQAAHYNMACAHARLGNLGDAILNLEKAFENGFDNYSTVRGDPDLDAIKNEGDFQKLLDTYDSKGFNPFGFLGKKK